MWVELRRQLDKCALAGATMMAWEGLVSFEKKKTIVGHEKLLQNTRIRLFTPDAMPVETIPVLDKFKMMGRFGIEVACLKERCTDLKRETIYHGQGTAPSAVMAEEEKTSARVVSRKNQSRLWYCSRFGQM